MDNWKYDLPDYNTMPLNFLWGEIARLMGRLVGLNEVRERNLSWEGKEKANALLDETVAHLTAIKEAVRARMS